METRFLLRLRDHHVLFGLVIWATLVLPSLSISVRSCSFPAMFNFGDSNSDTGGLSAAFGQAPYPNGETYFRTPSGRYSDGRLLIDFIGTSSATSLCSLNLSLSHSLHQLYKTMSCFCFCFCLPFAIMLWSFSQFSRTYPIRCRKGFGKLEKRNSFLILLASDLKLCCMWLHFMKDLDPPILSLPSWKTGQKFSLCMRSLVKNNMPNMPKVLGSVLRSYTKHGD